MRFLDSGDSDDLTLFLYARLSFMKSLGDESKFDDSPDSVNWLSIMFSCRTDLIVSWKICTTQKKRKKRTCFELNKIVFGKISAPDREKGARWFQSSLQ